MKLTGLNNYEKTLIAEALHDDTLQLEGYSEDDYPKISQVITCLQNDDLDKTTYNKIIELIRPAFGDVEEPAVKLDNGWVITADSFKYLEDVDRQALSLDTDVEERYLVPEYLKAKDLEEYFDLIEDVQADSYIDDDVMLEVIIKVIDNGWGYVPGSTYFRDNFCGVWEDFQSYANELIDELVMPELPEHLQNYFDEAAWARDLEHDYTVLDLPSGYVAVFRD